VRVDYILPALQPAIANESSETPEMVPAFRDHVRSPRAAPAPLPGGWEQQFRLDARPFTATYIGPPPRPHSLSLDNFHTERARWRNLVSRHGDINDSPTISATFTSTPAVATMIDMLRQTQQMEDSIVAQQVAITRG